MSATYKVPVPRRVKNPAWHQGLLVAANVRIEHGVPKFGETDTDWVIKAIITRTCQLCGTRIGPRTWCVFVGGPHDTHFTEAPLHMECAAYSNTVCPNILRKRETISYSLCKKYGFDVPTGMAVPFLDDYNQTDRLMLFVAHADGCGHKELGRLGYDEFMRLAT